jgi:LPS-assembly lipoprotein
MTIKQQGVFLVKTCASFLVIFVLTSCGFSLRGDYVMSSQLQTLFVSSTDTHSELTRVLKQQLTLNKVQVVKSFSTEIPEIRLLKDTLDRRTLSVFTNGQVAEYELIYTVRYELRINDRETQAFTFEINRDYQDDPDNALAKSRELTLMLSEMRQQAAVSIVRNIASLQP